MNLVWYGLAFAIALVVTLVATPMAIKLANRFNAIDYPDGRRINEYPTPRLGGVAIMVGILFSLGVLTLLFSPIFADIDLGLTYNINYIGVLLAVLLIFAVGLFDDFKNLRVRYKLVGQIAAATIACFSGVLFDTFTNPLTGDIIHIGLFAYPLTIFYLVAFANIINLIDGLDGLASGIVAISAITLFIISTWKSYSDVSLITLALAGSCIAFLKYNFHPAKVFMGDSGALSLGFILGLVSLFGATRTPVIITLLVPIVIAGIPALDTLTSIIRRIRSGKSVVAADTSHIHHRLMKIGYDQKTTAYILYVLTGLLSVVALLIIGRGDWVRVVALVVLVGVVAALVFALKLTEPILKHHFVKRPRKRGSKSNNDKSSDPSRDES